MLGYPFAGDYHLQRGRFSVKLRIQPSTEYTCTLEPSCIMAMIGRESHSLNMVMEQAMQFRDFASSIGRDLRMTLGVYLCDEQEGRE